MDNKDYANSLIDFVRYDDETFCLQKKLALLFNAEKSLAIIKSLIEKEKASENIDSVLSKINIDSVIFPKVIENLNDRLSKMIDEINRERKLLIDKVEDHPIKENKGTKMKK